MTAFPCEPAPHPAAATFSPLKRGEGDVALSYLKVMQELVSGGKAYAEQIPSPRFNGERVRVRGN